MDALDFGFVSSTTNSSTSATSQFVSSSSGSHLADNMNLIAADIDAAVAGRVNSAELVSCDSAARRRAIDSHVDASVDWTWSKRHRLMLDYSIRLTWLSYCAHAHGIFR